MRVRAISSSGANQHLALTSTIQTSIKTTTHMSTRAWTTLKAWFSKLFK